MPYKCMDMTDKIREGVLGSETKFKDAAQLHKFHTLSK